MLTAAEWFHSGLPIMPTADFRYDGDNNRLQQVVYSGTVPITTTYHNDLVGLSQVLLSDDGTTQTANLFGLDLVGSQTDSGGDVLYLLTDGLGSVRAEMAGSTLTAVLSYGPYGETVYATQNSDTAYGFTGEQEDSSTGFVYLRARYYSPGLKTFVTRDPWEGVDIRPASLGKYLYAENNPVLFVDPTGKWICAGESYAFNPNCNEWVEDALKKLKSQGGIPGERLASFFERHDSGLKWDTLGCIVFPPLVGRIWGIRISFNPVMPNWIGGQAAAIPPQDIFLDSTRINGAIADLEDVATFGHEISHLEQGFDQFFSVHSELLSTMLTYRLETQLGIAKRHPAGEIAKAGSYNPWNESDLEAFKNEMARQDMPLRYPLKPVGGYLPRNWFDQWGVAPFTNPSPLPSLRPTPPGTHLPGWLLSN